MKWLLLSFILQIAFWSIWSQSSVGEVFWSTCPAKTPTKTSEYSSASNLNFMQQFMLQFQQIKHMVKRFESALLFSETLGIKNVDWEYVSRFSNYSLRTNFESAQSALSAECGLMEVPLSYSNSNRNITVFVKRFKSRKPNNRIGQLWLLQGGPGGSGSVFDDLAPILLDVFGDKFDLMIPDHRGTGRSTFLQCKNTALNAKNFAKTADFDSACFNELLQNYGAQGLPGFSTTEAATDLYYWIQKTKQPSDQVVVYGVSYGTYLLNRILYLYPNLVNMAIADSVVSNSMDFIERDDHYLETGNAFAQVCSNTPFCANKFSNYGGFANALSTVIAKQSDVTTMCINHPMLTGSNLKRLLAQTLPSSSMRKLIAPFVFRLLRCTWRDRNFLSNIIFMLSLVNRGPVQQESDAKSRLSSSIVDGPAPDSNALFSYIAQSELTMRPTVYKPEDWITKYTPTPPHFYLGFSSSFTESVIANNNKLYSSPLKSYATNYNNPLLIMQGTLDPQTPTSFFNHWSNAFGSMPNVFKVQFSNAVHGVIYSTPMKQISASGLPQFCSMQVMREFLNNPTQQPDTTCITNGQTVDSPTFDFSPTVSQILPGLNFMLGGDDIFESGPIFNISDIPTYIIAILLFSATCLCCSCCILFSVVGGVALYIVQRNKKSMLSPKTESLITNSFISDIPSSQYYIR